ncbi:MAG TPA: DMT family transporter [Thermoanaerobaculia bacterium]|nr:DMT family transporter [Thermoanaerobaculia bacterium]
MLPDRPAEVQADAARRFRADAVLIGVTVVWGSSFVVVKNAFAQSPPLQFLFWRFLIAVVLIAPFLAARRRTPGLVRDGLVIGLLLAGGMSLQVLGIPGTSASKAAFLTGLSVVLTPFAAWLRTRKLPSLENGIGVTFAGAGFFLLTFPAVGGPVNRGDVLVFGCGVVFAFYIVELAERSARHDAVWLTAFQLVTVVAVAGIASLALRLPALAALPEAAAEARPVVWRGTFLWSVLYLGSLGTVGTFFCQTWAQARMSATHAAIIFALEPVFAAILAAWLLGDHLGARGAAGGALVLAGIVVSEMRLSRAAPP